jgi:uncharacterized damage-inducible protein DinB
MTGRPHKDRLLHDLDEIRMELAGEVRRIKPEELNWAPRSDMKTFKALLLEIGAMEKVCMHWLAHQTMFDWKEAEAAVGSDANDPGGLLEGLGRVREATLGYLNACSEEKLQTPVPVPKEWEVYWGSAIEPEETVRWIARHEYYHLGQIISYRWILGDNPYQREAGPTG